MGEELRITKHNKPKSHMVALWRSSSGTKRGCAGCGRAGPKLSPVGQLAFHSGT
jgi:hypothetical protein